jgi:hypothetical protein
MSTSALSQRFPVSRQAVDLEPGVRFQGDLDRTVIGREMHIPASHSYSSSLQQFRFAGIHRLFPEIAFIDNAPGTLRALHRKGITAFVLVVSGVAFDPLPGDLVDCLDGIEPFPEILVAEPFPRAAHPAEALPLSQPPFGHGVDEVL